MIQRLARYLLTPWLWKFSTAELGLGSVSWSQFGEDLILKGMFPEQQRGVYVDVGAFHPIYLSNTYAFYRAGWSGLAIDVNEQMPALFAKFRPRDRVVHSAVGTDQAVKMRTFAHGVFNCLEEHAASVPAQFQEGSKVITIQSKPLTVLLEQNGITKIDFLNVDCEGADLKILQSNDWERWQPTVVCVEDHSETWQTTTTTEFLLAKGYRLAHRAGLSSIFQHASPC